MRSQTSTARPSLRVSSGKARDKTRLEIKTLHLLVFLLSWNLPLVPRNLPCANPVTFILIGWLYLPPATWNLLFSTIGLVDFHFWRLWLRVTALPPVSPSEGSSQSHVPTTSSSTSPIDHKFQKTGTVTHTAVSGAVSGSASVLSDWMKMQHDGEKPVN